MKSTQNRTVARLALATWAMVATLTGAAYGQTPSVSVEAIEDTAAPGIVRAAWRFTLSAAQTTDVTISFEVSYDPAVGTNYLNIESTQILIFPAGVTTGTVSHDMSAYTGTVNGTVTATLSAGTGYTVAASPNNAATISVIAASQLIAIDLGPDVQVNEGEAANFRITWSTVNGAPAPTQHLTYVLAPVSGTAIIVGEVDAADIVTGSGISTDAIAGTAGQFRIGPNDWIASGTGHSVTATFSVQTVEDTETEIQERFYLGFAKLYSESARIQVKCKDTAHTLAPHTYPGGCAVFVDIIDDDGEVRAVVEVVDAEPSFTVTEAVTEKQIAVKLDREAPTNGVTVKYSLEETNVSIIPTDMIPARYEGTHELHFNAGEREKLVEYRVEQTPGVVDITIRPVVTVTVLPGENYAVKLGSNLTSSRIADGEWRLNKEANWVGGSTTVEESSGTLTVTARLSVPFAWEVTRELKRGYVKEPQDATEDEDFTLPTPLTVTWPAQTRDVDVQIEVLDNETAEDDESFAVLFEKPVAEYWGEMGRGGDDSDLYSIRIEDDDPVIVAVTNSVNDERPRENFTEGDSFELFAEIVPPCEVYASGRSSTFALDVPVEIATGLATLPAGTAETHTLSFNKCNDKATLTFETVDDSDDEYYRDLWIAFWVKNPVTRSQIYDGDGDIGRFELAEGSKATGFKVRDNDGGGRALSAVSDGGNDTWPPGDTKSLPPMDATATSVVWDVIANDDFNDGDKALIRIVSVTQPEAGTVEIVENETRVKFTRDFDDSKLINFEYTIEAPKWGGGTLREDTSVASHIRERVAPATEETPPRSTGTSVEGQSDSAWNPGDKAKVQIEWNENVTVTGRPTVGITMGGASKTATYEAGSGSSTLTFAYELTNDDGTLHDVLLTANSLALAGGSIQDDEGTDAVLDHEGSGQLYSPPRPQTPTPPETNGQSVDAESDESWKPGDTITARIDWNENVTVTGTPSVELELDGSTGRQAAYAGGSGSAELRFEYTVTESDGWTYDVKLTSDSLSASGATIQDAEGTNAVLDHRSAQRTYTSPDPLTVSWTAPDEHDGDTFVFEVEFSDDPVAEYSYRTMRDHTLEASGGTVKQARRLNTSSEKNRRWEITLEPDETTSDIALTLETPSGCSDAHAVCTVDGRALSNSLSKTIAGPVGVGVADASQDEGDDVTMDFTVSLSEAASEAISVDYATQDGTASAGSDYTSTSGTLQFAAGDTSKTIEVPLLDDDHDEGSETFKLVLSNPSGAVVTDSEATGTIRNRDPLPRALLARFGRATAVHVVEQIQARVDAKRDPGTTARFGGMEMTGGIDAVRAAGLFRQLLGPGAGATAPMPGAMAGSDPAAIGAQATMPAMSGAGSPGSGMAPGAPMASNGPLGSDHHRSAGLIGQSAMTMNRTTAAGATVSFWSRGAESRFQGREGTLGLEGDVRSALFGADYAKGRWIVGMSAGRSWGTGTYQGKTSGRTHSSVNGVYPWIGYKVNERVSVWGVSGYGRGRLLLTPQHGGALESTLRMRMSAIGAQAEVRSDNGQGIGLTLKTDALRTTTSVDEVDGPAGRLAATRADVSRVRAAIEGSRRYSVGGGIGLRSSVELGVRRDGGDAEQGAGLDLGVGLAMDERQSGLQVELRVRRLIVHEAEAFAEQGVSISINYDPTPESPLGLTAEISPGWGGETTSGAEALWGRETMGGIGAHQTAGGNRLDSRVGYGLPLGSRLVGTPQFGVLNGQHGRSYRVGYAIRPRNAEKLQIEIGIDAERRDRGGLGPAANSIRIGANGSW